MDAHIATLPEADEARLREEFTASIESDFHRADFRKKAWKSTMNDAAVIAFFSGRYDLAFPSSEDTARELALSTTVEINAEIGKLQGQINKIG